MKYLALLVVWLLILLTGLVAVEAAEPEHGVVPVTPIATDTNLSRQELRQINPEDNPEISPLDTISETIRQISPLGPTKMFSIPLQSPLKSP